MNNDNEERCTECEATCDYIQYRDWDEEEEIVCCNCDSDTEKWKMCGDCFSGYASDIYDSYKAEKEMRA